MSAAYTGPTAKEMIATHTLATETIKRHNLGAEAVFDGVELRRLRAFCDNPANKDIILRNEGMTDGPGDAPGTKAGKSFGSLAGYVIARHGTENPIFETWEIDILKRWFDSGAADKAMEED